MIKFFTDIIIRFIEGIVEMFNTKEGIGYSVRKGLAVYFSWHIVEIANSISDNQYKFYAVVSMEIAVLILIGLIVIPQLLKALSIIKNGNNESNISQPISNNS